MQPSLLSRLLSAGRFQHGSSRRARLSETSSAAAWYGALFPGTRRPASPVCSLEPDHVHWPRALCEAAAASATPFSPALPPPGSGLKVDTEHPALQASLLQGSLDERPPETQAYLGLPVTCQNQSRTSPRGWHTPDAAPGLSWALSPPAARTSQRNAGVAPEREGSTLPCPEPGQAGPPRSRRPEVARWSGSALEP